MPFISELEKNCDIIQIKSDVDYRQKMILHEYSTTFHEKNVVKCFLYPKSKENIDKFEHYLNKFACGKPEKNLTLEVNTGRCIKFPCRGSVSKISFDHIMKSEFGSSDFRAIFRNVSILFLENMTPVDLSFKNESARFIMFVSLEDRRALQSQDQTVRSL